jgi:XTP/dITP diphosphohydrolase
LLADFPFELHGFGELGVAPPEETGSSFLENAMLKARHAATAATALGIGGTAAGGQGVAVASGIGRTAADAPGGAVASGIGGSSLCGVLALADDSGLEVDALGGGPGIFSARYAGVGADDAANNAKLLDALAGMCHEQRRARYRCVLVLTDGHDDAAPLIAEGVWEGIIVDTPRGTGGFGYDRYFWLPELGVTAAELDPADKNRLSHRGMAMRSLRDQLAARKPQQRRP